MLKTIKGLYSSIFQQKHFFIFQKDAKYLSVFKCTFCKAEDIR